MKYEEFSNDKSVVSGLYVITNLSNGKMYIGKSENIFKRWRKHVREDERFAIHAALTKYGLGSFDFKVLVVAQDNDYLRQLEIDAIRVFSTVAPTGYNLTLGGDGGKLILACAETKAKHSASVTSSKFREKISKTSKERWSDEGFRSKRISDLREMGSTKEFKESCSRASKSNWSNPEYVAKMREVQSSEEHREVLRQTAAKLWSDPKYRLKLTAKTHSCFWCGADVSKSQYNQNHGDKCKDSPYWVEPEKDNWERLYGEDGLGLDPERGLIKD